MLTSPSPVLAAWLVAATALTADAITLPPQAAGAPRAIELPIQRRNIVDPLRHDRMRMRKRAGTVDSTLDNEAALYSLNITIGTPSQNLEVQVDTGSSDLWVNVPNSDYCSDRQNGCASTGTYDANSSSTYQYVNGDFNITYAAESGADGDYVTDVVSFSGISIQDQQFGVGYISSSPQGVMGIGYTANEASVAHTGGTYPNIPQSMLEDGLIGSLAYSLWLNDLDASTGSILFGGVNSDKYTGTLETLPISQQCGVYAQFIITLTGIGANGTSNSIASSQTIPALLDSGTSLTYLPVDVAEDIYTSLGTQYDSRTGTAIVDCDLADSDATLDFTFSSPTIRVPLNELVLLAGYNGRRPVCMLGLAPSDSLTVLGDTFLRSAYVVYDLANNEISIAQTDFNSTSDNIQEISNSTGVPGAQAVQNAVVSTNLGCSSGDSSESEPGSYTTVTSGSAAHPTLAPAWNVAMLGAAGAAALFAL